MIDHQIETFPDIQRSEIVEAEGEIESLERAEWAMGRDPLWEIEGWHNGWTGPDPKIYPPMVLGVSRRFERYATVW